jgi:ubiquinone/menaquinone biosynthesis C-methylase UbiE
MNAPRVDYDAIADIYDSIPYREKTVDPELRAFVAQRVSADEIVVLDIGCGTGNQLVANHSALNSAQMIGLDRFAGMLRQACRKAPEIGWVQGDGSVLPFHGESIDFVSCQFALHHISQKDRMLRETSTK